MLNYKKYITPLLLISVLTISSCFLFKAKNNKNNYWLLYNPPWTIKVDTNFYCDEKEIDNISWIEYVFWNKKVFGSSSKEYLESLPNTLVWNKFDTCSHSLRKYYNSPMFYTFPIVGISQKQAKKYSKWRSDRVFEHILINLGIIKSDYEQTKETYFTIEKYYNGNLSSFITSEKIKYYPDYHLPTFKERKHFIYYNDSIKNSFNKKCKSKNYKSKKCKEYKKYISNFIANISPCANGTFIYPTKDISFYNTLEKYIYNIRGNVSEWGAEKNISFGGSWINSKERILQSDTFHCETANAWTGFRNTCTWKEWNKSNSK